MKGERKTTNLNKLGSMAASEQSHLLDSLVLREACLMHSVCPAVFSKT